MRLLLVTYYYPPDLSAGSYRSAALVKALRRVGPPDLEIEVLTTLPNRYASYRCAGPVTAGLAPDPESGASVRRIPVGRHRSGLIDQGLGFAGFHRRALHAARGERYDIVVATTSRVLTGYLGSVIAKRSGARFYLDVRDLFIENVRTMFGLGIAGRVITALLGWIERRSVERAQRVNLVSEGFLDYFRQRYPGRQFSLFGNGIDPEFIDYDFRKQEAGAPYTILYAGNIGLGQGIETIVPQVAGRLGPEFRFRIIGDGGRRAELERLLRATGAGNVALLPPMSRRELLEEYRAADYLLLHLNAFPSLEKVLPSKLFEYAATGKPILAGVGGVAARFIAEHVDGAAVFAPGDAEGMLEALRSLERRHWDRRRFREEFARERIMLKMARDVLD